MTMPTGSSAYPPPDAARVQQAIAAMHQRLGRLRRARIAAGAGAAVVVAIAIATFVAATIPGRRDVLAVRGQAQTSSTVAAPTTTTRDATSTTAVPFTSTATTAPVVCASCTVTTQTVPSPAQAGDFTGRLDHWGDICEVCLPDRSGHNVQLMIHNITDHPIDLSPSAPTRVAVVCSTNLTADGRLTAPLGYQDADLVDWFYDANGFRDGGGSGGVSVDAILAPGAEASTGPLDSGPFGDAYIGTRICEGAIVTTSDSTWSNQSLSVVARITNIPTWSYRVVPAPPTTTEPTSTTAPVATTTSTSVP